MGDCNSLTQVTYIHSFIMTLPKRLANHVTSPIIAHVISPIITQGLPPRVLIVQCPYHVRYFTVHQVHICTILQVDINTLYYSDMTNFMIIFINTPAIDRYEVQWQFVSNLPKIYFLHNFFFSAGTVCPSILTNLSIYHAARGRGGALGTSIL